ncbi:IS1380-Spn1, transposase [Heyndrickxia coagulans]|nr:IS1380-Spn1, transposase [Heyndrickxia coagulans]
MAKSYIGLLCQGESDYDNIETFREDAFFALALDIQRVPSSPTLRQRLDQAALTEKWKAILHEESLNLIRNTNAEISPVYAKDKPYIPVDLDVSPFDNSKTKKKEWKEPIKAATVMHLCSVTLGRKATACMLRCEREITTAKKVRRILSRKPSNLPGD